MSIDKGLIRGAQYCADYFRCLEEAAKIGVKHPEQVMHLLTACAKPGGDWLKEAAAVKGIDLRTGSVNSAILLAMVIGDPFAGSRHDVQDLKKELGVT